VSLERWRGLSTRTISRIVPFFHLLSFIAAHAVGQGAVIRADHREVFPTGIGSRSSLGSFTHLDGSSGRDQLPGGGRDRSGARRRGLRSFLRDVMVVQLAWNR
jgi:hypothetical protein